MCATRELNKRHLTFCLTNSLLKDDGIIIIGFYKINNRLNNNDLKIGDVITKISDKEVFTIDDMVKTIEETVQDNKVRITVLRNKKEKTIEREILKIWQQKRKNQ